MWWYLGKRLLQLIPVFFGATFLIYAMVFLMPGDPVLALAGDKAAEPAVLDQIRADYNLDKPFLVQYFLFIGGFFTGDMGTTFSGRAVTEVLAETFPITIRLALMALVIEAVMGIVFGLIAGLRKGSWFDSTLLVVSLFIIAVPTFVIGFVGQFLFGIKWGVVPPTVGSDGSFSRLLLPAIVLGMVSFAYVLRLTRSEVAQNLRADFVRTASARGLSRGVVVRDHVLRNSLVPVVTFLGADLAVLMGGAIVTEGIFNIHGVGGLIFQSVSIGEAPTVVSVVTILVVIFVVANLIIDLLYALLDPRIRYA
ncbi:MAG: ABC transporter permease [Corynebacterium sp.]|uniref:ABC transporter permease n=3 Tax=Corynebacterium TaxID=1716 RepID=UPI0026476EA6|nr:ABC transporter permease [Corynebacterium sp.]MDN5581039.1 ABC transporter permease [Corynebacterium sp.]MDN5719922.1 ABC transporter permease [Corynebacterium sp.]MDN6323878.1 ABC transporter permease [Corynebacterium sp.]MDN6386216.1 ABC transporter permease [Corynebacterium sp.]MDN6509929.1 ABC transporter permease [Corynebacterium sp.]